MRAALFADKPSYAHSSCLHVCGVRAECPEPANGWVCSPSLHFDITSRPPTTDLVYMGGI